MFYSLLKPHHSFVYALYRHTGARGNKFRHNNILSYKFYTIISSHIAEVLGQWSLHEPCFVSSIPRFDYVRMHIYTGRTQKNGAVSIEMSIETATFVCVYSVYTYIHIYIYIFYRQSVCITLSQICFSCQ
jgi:hypothetical protein